MPKNNKATQTARKTNLTLFSAQVRFLNFKENMGTSLTNNQQDTKMATSIVQSGMLNIQL